MASAFNNKIDDVLYKCRKLVTKSDFTRHSCKWHGSLGDYISHIKSKHSESYFEIQNEQTFTWKLPYKENQTDKGVIQNQGDYFLYEIYYDYQKEKILIFIACIRKLTSNFKEIYFLSILKDDNRNKNISNSIQFKPEELCKDISQRKCTKIIDKNKFVKDNRIIKFVINMQ